MYYSEQCSLKIFLKNSTKNTLWLSGVSSWCYLYFRFSIYHSQISQYIEQNMKGRQLKLFSDHELKSTSYLTFMGELWGIFCKLFGEKLARDIKHCFIMSGYCCTMFCIVWTFLWGYFSPGTTIQDFIWCFCMIPLMLLFVRLWSQLTRILYL